MILALAVFAVSCTKDKLSTNNNIVGKWFITTFTDDGIDKTIAFAPYDFTFDEQGDLSINGGSMMSMCNWTMMDSIYHFDMMGMHDDPLDALDDDWMMTDFSDSTCAFSDDNPNRNCTFMMHKM